MATTLPACSLTSSQPPGALVMPIGLTSPSAMRSRATGGGSAAIVPEDADGVTAAVGSALAAADDAGGRADGEGATALEPGVDPHAASSQPSMSSAAEERRRGIGAQCGPHRRPAPVAASIR
jgi:hypothetical protein